jgi:hypothetical protein
MEADESADCAALARHRTAESALSSAFMALNVLAKWPIRPTSDALCF